MWYSVHSMWPFSNFGFAKDEETDQHSEKWRKPSCITQPGSEELRTPKSELHASVESYFYTVYQVGWGSFVSVWNFENMRTNWKQKKAGHSLCFWYILWLASCRLLTSWVLRPSAPLRRVTGSRAGLSVQLQLPPTLSCELFGPVCSVTTPLDL